MKINTKTIAFIGAIALVPALAFAQAKSAPATPKTAQKGAALTSAPAKPAATHATNGVIKSSDATSLVITKTAKDTKTTTFVLNAATVTKGTLTAGARVEVRYRAEGGQNIATAVTVAAPKSAKAPKAGNLPKSGK